MSDLFHQSRLATFEKDGERWVAMRPIVEGMGLSWQGQQEKLNGNRGRFNYQGILTVGADGKSREMGCIPLWCYPLWLATINPAKIPRPEVQQRVDILISSASQLLKPLRPQSAV